MRRVLVLLGCLLAVGAGASHAWAIAPPEAYDDPAPYCAAVRTIDAPDWRYVGKAVPDWVARALARAVGGPRGSVAPFRNAVWRCADGRVLACAVGADIPCATRADTARTPPPGAVAFCTGDPQAPAVPAVATGRATVFAWRCQEGAPAIVRQVVRVDGQGYPALFWYVVRR